MLATSRVGSMAGSQDVEYNQALKNENRNACRISSLCCACIFVIGGGPYVDGYISNRDACPFLVREDVMRCLVQFNDRVFATMALALGTLDDLDLVVIVADDGH